LWVSWAETYKNLHYRIGDPQGASLHLLRSIAFSDNDFITLDESVLTSPRKADGSLPETGFMKIKPTSKLFVVLKGIGY